MAHSRAKSPYYQRFQQTEASFGNLSGDRLRNPRKRGGKKLRAAPARTFADCDTVAAKNPVRQELAAKFGLRDEPGCLPVDGMERAPIDLIVVGNRNCLGRAARGIRRSLM